MSEERLKAVESDVIELKSSVNQVCNSIQGLTSEIREMVKQGARDGERWHQQAELNSRLATRIDQHDKDITSLKINQAVSTSRIDPLIGMFWKVSGSIAILAAVGGIAYKVAT